MTVPSRAHDSAPALRVHWDWDAEALETAAITPAGALTAVITWENFPDTDGGVPQQLTQPLARALLSVGEGCFRWAGTGPGQLCEIGRIGMRLPFTPSWRVVRADSTEGVLCLFDAGWAQGDQMAAIGASRERSMELIGAKRLTGMALVREEVLVAPIVDGAGLMIAAPRAVHRDRVIEAVTEASRSANVPVLRA